jgi:hypothetical protein
LACSAGPKAPRTVLWWRVGEIVRSGKKSVEREGRGKKWKKCVFCGGAVRADEQPPLTLTQQTCITERVKNTQLGWAGPTFEGAIPRTWERFHEPHTTTPKNREKKSKPSAYDSKITYWRAGRSEQPQGSNGRRHGEKAAPHPAPPAASLHDELKKQHTPRVRRFPTARPLARPRGPAMALAPPSPLAIFVQVNHTVHTRWCRAG